MVEGDDGDCVFRLQQVAVGGVVHQYHVLEAPVDHPQVLQEVAPLQSAMLPVESVRNPLFVRVEIVEHNVSVGGCAGREDDDLCDLGELF